MAPKKIRGPALPAGSGAPESLPDEVDLVPVIELRPERFDTEDRRPPRTNWDRDPKGWRRYWSSCLADSGIVGIEAVHGMLVPVSELSEADLAKICEKHFEEGDWNVEPEVLGPLEGGYVLRSRGSVHIVPTCCGDLDDLYDWERAVRHCGSEWRMLWIGHPWVSIKTDGDRFVLSEPHEDDAGAKPRLTVSQEALTQAVARAREQRDRFRVRLVPALEKVIASEGRIDQVVDALTGSD